MLNISIVLYKNQEEQIKLLIKDIIENDGGIINKIYLIDNSPNNYLEKLSELNVKIFYIHTTTNLGYGAAHNIAIKQSIDSNIKYHLVVNPDIRMEKNVLAKLAEYLDMNSDVGLVMPDIRYPNGERQYLCKLLPTPLSLFSRRFLPKIISSKFDYKYNLLGVDYSKEMNVPVLSGCFMFMRTSAIAEVGMFDSRFFMYLEDFDLVRRIHVKYRTVFYPNVKVIHEYAKGSYRNFKLMRYHIVSAIKYFNKYGWINDKVRKQINKKFFENVLKL